MRTILLAAGLSTRMGTQKLLLPFDGNTIVGIVLDNLYRAGLIPVCAVFSQKLAKKITDRPSWLEVGINHEPERGQSSSLAVGLNMLPDGEDFCVMLGDLPLAKSESMAALRRKFENRPAGYSVLAPVRDGAFGHPMFYAAVWKKRFAAAEGDTGGKVILEHYRSEIILTETEEGHFKDIDTPAVYESLRPAKR